MRAISEVRFPSLAPPSCDFHGREGVRCTPMDCQFYRLAPARLVVLTQNQEVESVEQALAEVAEVIEANPHIPSVPIKRKGKGKR